MMYPEKNCRKHMTGESPSTPISHRTWLLGGLSVYSYADFTIVFADVWERDERSLDDGSSSVPKKLTESKALPKTSVLSENRPSPKNAKKILFQPWIFRCYVSLSVGVFCGSKFIDGSSRIFLRRWNSAPHLFWLQGKKADVVLFVDLEMRYIERYPLQRFPQKTTESKYCICFLGP